MSRPPPFTREEFHARLRRFALGKYADEPVKPSLVVPCPACDGGWRDTPTGTVMCGQCRGTGQRATNGGEA